MRFVRSLAFVVWMYGLMMIMGLACAPALLGPRAWARACLMVWLRLVFWGLSTLCGVRVEVRGADHLPKGAALVAMKHQSMVDTLWPWLALPDPAIILKRSLAYLPVFGWYAMKLKNIAVDRAAGASALRAMARAAAERAAQGRQILIFPEGTRGEPGQRYAYKPGVAALYTAMGVACTPIALNSGLFWPAHGITRSPGVIVIEVLEPIPPGLDRKTFMATLEARLETAAEALLAEAGGPRGADAAEDAASQAPTSP